MFALFVEQRSGQLQCHGAGRTEETLEGEDVAISDITTDRHPQVKKFMREQHPEINDWFDLWHVAKGVSKQKNVQPKRATFCI